MPHGAPAISSQNNFCIQIASLWTEDAPLFVKVRWEVPVPKTSSHKVLTEKCILTTLEKVKKYPLIKYSQKSAFWGGIKIINFL